MLRDRYAILMALGVVLCLVVPSHAASNVEVQVESTLTDTSQVPLSLLAIRLQVMQQLIEMGHDPEKARRQVCALTEEDLIVLGANPDMMQEAGAGDAQMTNFWLSLLLVAGFFALLAAGDGTFIQSS